MLRFAVRASTLTTWIALSAGEPTGMAYWWARSRSVCGSVWCRDRSLLEWCTPREAWPCVPPYCKWWIAVLGNVVLIDNRNGDAFVVARYVLSLQISVWIDLHLLNKQLWLDLCSFGQRALCSGHLWAHIWQPYTDKELLFGGVKKPLTVSCGTSTLRSVFTNLLCFSYNCSSSPEEGRTLHCSPITHKFTCTFGWVIFRRRASLSYTYGSYVSFGQVKLIDFSPGEKFMVTYSSHEPSNPRDTQVFFLTFVVLR